MPVVRVLEMLGMSSRRIPRSSQGCLDKNKVMIISVMVINIQPIRPMSLLQAALSLVAMGMSSLLVIQKVLARFIPAAVIWAPESAVAGAWAGILVTLGRGKESS